MNVTAAPDKPHLFLDSSTLFAAVHSESGGLRLLLKLGEMETVSLWVGPQVLQEVDAVLLRKSPASRPRFALLLDRAGVQIGPAASVEVLDEARTVIDYEPDAQILAEAIAAQVDYLVTLDRQHFVGNPRAALLPFPIGTPGDCLAWLRARLTPQP